jgi:hypothetical protein
MLKRSGLIQFALVLALIFTPTTAYSQYNLNKQPLQGSVVEVPAGRSIDVELETAVSTEVSRVGDRISTRVTNGFYDNGRLVFPHGTKIEGVITELEPAGRTGRNAIIAMKFTQAITPSGHRVPINAIVNTRQGEGVIKGGSKKGRIGKSLLRGVESAAAGAVLGTALGAASGGRVGKGAIYGTAIGGGVGLASNLIRKGKDVKLPTGTNMDIVLLEPVRVYGR